MKKLLALLILCPIFVACSSDDDDSSNKKYDQLVSTQNETYNAVNKVLVGHWEGTSQYNSTTGKWNNVTNIWSQYTFRSDGTFTRIENGVTAEGNYRLYKNEKYLENLSGVRPVHLSLEDITIPRTYSAWMDDEGYLRLDDVSSFGLVTSESGIRYSKQ